MIAACDLNELYPACVLCRLKQNAEMVSSNFHQHSQERVCIWINLLELPEDFYIGSK
jgi:hypothetical protein